jgi:hypothetical protein
VGSRGIATLLEAEDPTIQFPIVNAVVRKDGIGSNTRVVRKTWAEALPNPIRKGLDQDVP